MHRARFRPMSQALPARDPKVLLKLVVEIASGKVLGCHMVGEHAAEIIQMAAIAIGMGATKADFDRTMALHPIGGRGVRHHGRLNHGQFGSELLFDFRLDGAVAQRVTDAEQGIPPAIWSSSRKLWSDWSTLPERIRPAQVLQAPARQE